MLNQHRGERPMMTRLVLVGMVAALGISVRTWSEIQLGMAAVHAWTAGQLAAWDAPARSDSGPIGVAPPPKARRPVFEPMIAGEGATGIAYELNRASEGLDIHPQPVIIRRRPNESKARAQVLRSRVELSDASAYDTIEMKVMATLLRAADGSDAAGRPAEPTLTVRRSKPVIPPAVCTFTSATAGAHSAHHSIAAPMATGPGPGGVSRKPDLIEPVLDAGTSIDRELNRFAEGTEVFVRTPVVPARSKPAFSPIAPAVHSVTGLADELNRASQGLITVAAPIHRNLPPAPDSAARRSPPPRTPAPPERSPAPGPSSDIAQAMRLTREAVHAWMNVMTGSSRLHLSAR
jgi:hypothetical protein